MPKTLSLNNISKSYLKHNVLTSVTLEISPGTVTLLLGANGSGKSTLLQIAAGILRPDDGTRESTGSFGFVGHRSFLYQTLTVEENLNLHANISNHALDIRSKVEAWGLDAVTSKQTSDLSEGLKRRVALAREMSFDKDLLLLDEPTSSLDESSIDTFKSMLKTGTEKECSFLIASHDLSSLIEVADRVVLLNKGVIAEDSSDSSIKEVIDAYREANR